MVRRVGGERGEAACPEGLGLWVLPEGPAPCSGGASPHGPGEGGRDGRAGGRAGPRGGGGEGRAGQGRTGQGRTPWVV